MHSTKLFASTVLTLLAIGCAHEAPPAPAENTAPVAPQRVLASSAVRAHGDLIPGRLTAVALPKPTETETIVLSDPASIHDVHHIDRVAEVESTRIYRHLVTAADEKGLSLPIDAPAGTRVAVSVRDKKVPLTLLHLRDLKNGKIVDRARELTIAKIGALPSGKLGPGAPALAPEPVITAPAGLAPATGAEATVKIDPDTALATAAMPSRILSIDAPMVPGLVRLEVSPEAIKAGVIIEVQQPNSQIVLSGAPKELFYGFGDTAEVVFSLVDGATPISNANLSAVIELPNGEKMTGVSFTALGNGQYVAKIPLASADVRHAGNWHLMGKAKGTTAEGIAFERDLDAVFSYTPSHAQILSAMTPEVVRGKDDLIDDIKVDVELETVVEDRLGLHATLTWTGADGLEHPIAQAQTGITMLPGKKTVTLHFESKDVALSKTGGPFHVRDLALVSYAFATTQHRLGRGLDLTTLAIKPTELRMPENLTPAAAEAVKLGAF